MQGLARRSESLRQLIVASTTISTRWLVFFLFILFCLFLFIFVFPFLFFRLSSLCCTLVRFCCDRSLREFFFFSHIFFFVVFSGFCFLFVVIFIYLRVDTSFVPGYSFIFEPACCAKITGRTLFIACCRASTSAQHSAIRHARSSEARAYVPIRVR